MVDNPAGGIADDKGQCQPPSPSSSASPPPSKSSNRFHTSPKVSVVTPPPRTRTRSNTLSPKISRCVNNSIAPSPIHEPKRNPPVTKSNTVVSYDDSGCRTYTSIMKQPQSPQFNRVQSVPQSPLGGVRLSGAGGLGSSPLAASRSVPATSGAGGAYGGLHRVGISGANDTWSLKRWLMCCFPRRFMNYPPAGLTIGVRTYL